MMLALLAALAATSPQAGAVMPAPQGGGYAVTLTSVYLRRTPSLPGPVIDEIKGDTLMKVISCGGGWCALDLGPRAGVGYLTQDVLIAVPPPAP